MTDDTKNRLLDAAGHIFSEKGFELATVREICEARTARTLPASTTLATSSVCISTRCARRSVRAWNRCRCPIWRPGLPAAERLREFIHVMLSRMLYADRPAWHMGLMLRELASPTAACKEVVDDYIRPMAEELERILVELLPDHLSRSQVYLFGFSIVGQCLFYSVHRPIAELLIGIDEYRNLSIDQLCDHIASFSLAGLGHALPLPSSVSKR